MRYGEPAESGYEADKLNGSVEAMDIDTPKSKPGSTNTSPKETNGASKEESLRAQTAMKEGTLRYMVDVHRAAYEQDIVYGFFNDKTEEYEVEEEVSKPKRRK